MYRHSVLALMCSLAAGLPLAASAAPAPETVPTDSFIVQHVGTAAQLHQQISLDPVVRRRLARHFHTSAPAVTRYIQNNLVLKKLKSPGRYRVYCVGRSGQEYTINSRLAAGTPVFVLRSTGQPILKLACGNPMVASLPPVVTKVGPYRSPALASSPKPGPAALPATLQSSGPVVVAMNDAPGVVVMPTTKVAGFISQLPISHGGSPLGFLAAIPILATVASHHGGGSSTGTTGTTGTNTLGNNTTSTNTNGNNTTSTSTNGNNTTSTNTNGNNTTSTNTNGNNTGITAVPEPSTPAAFTVGGLVLLFLLGGAKRRSRSRAQ